MPEGDPFRDQLADDDVQIGDEQEREAVGNDRCEDRVEDASEDLLADGTDTQARDRHAELHRGDEPRRVRSDPENGSCATVALVAELRDAGAARRDERVLGRDEERVQQEQACDREELEEESHAPLSGARVLGGWSSLKGDRL